MKHILIAISALLLFASCEVEFSPNDQWHNIPVVYCLLDQDDDTTFVRVQRCFLGEGNQYRYAAIFDSVNYPQGSVTVLMEEWNTWIDNDGERHQYGDSPRRIYNFDYTLLTDKDSGIFFNTLQPVYFCPTGGQLDTTCLYILKVIQNASGDTIAKAHTLLIRGNMKLQQPNNVTLFQFGGASGNKSCDIKWTTIRNARQYQPIVRFYYRDFIINRSQIPWDTTITPHFIDIPCNVIKSNLRENVCSTKLEQNTFLSYIKKSLEGDTCNKNVIDTVDIFIHCGTEDLAAYLYASHPLATINQEPFIYTNIEGGIGVFAARRTHIFFRIGTPLSSASDYIKSLKELGVGF